MFLTVMAHVMEESGWAADKIVHDFNKKDGHYIAMPGKKPPPKSTGGCAIL